MMAKARGKPNAKPVSSGPGRVSAKAQAESQIRDLAAQGFSEREIARRAGLKGQGTVWNVLNPEAHRGGVRESAAEEILRSLRQHKHNAMLLPRDYGSVWVEPANRRERSKVGSYWAALKRAREDGDWSGLAKFRGRFVSVIEKGKREKLQFLSDRDRDILDRLEDKNVLEPKEVVRGKSP